MHERGLVGGDADHRLLELHLDQPALGAELDDVALDLDRHARDELGALEHGEHVVQRHAALELERGQAGGDLVEAAAVLVERRERLVGLGEHGRDVLEDVLRAVEVERDDARGAARWRSRARRSAWRRARRCGGGCRSRARGSSGPASAGRSPTRSSCRSRQHDRAVHLRELVEQRGRVVDVELDAAREAGSELVRLADARSGRRCGAWTMLSMPSRTAVPGRDHLEGSTSLGSCRASSSASSSPAYGMKANSTRTAQFRV